MKSPNVKTCITELPYDALVSWLESKNIAKYRAGQILKWIYLRQADSFDVMSDIKKDIRKLLADHFSIRRLEKIMIEKLIKKYNLQTYQYCSTCHR